MVRELSYTKKTENNSIFKVNVDGLFDIHYVHYRFDPNCKEIQKKSVDVFYSNIKEYIKIKYETRCKRMLELNKEPTFVITCHQSDYTLENQMKILNANKKYHLVLITDFPDKLCASKNNKIIKWKHPAGTCLTQAKTYNDEILKF